MNVAAMLRGRRRWPPDMEGSCECVAHAVADSQWGAIFQPRSWAWVNLP